MLREFLPDLAVLKDSGKISKGIVPATLPIEEEAVIAAAATETLVFVAEIFDMMKERRFNPNTVDWANLPPWFRFDRSIVVNGLGAQLRIPKTGCPEFLLDDLLDVDGPISAYSRAPDGKIIKYPMKYVALYRKLDLMGLLSSSKPVHL